MTPPPDMIFVGGGDFSQIGNQILDYLKQYGLKPEHRVLDIGCGIGRIAIPLTGYLTAKGSYDGFDIREDGIKWCQEKITPLYPKFKFKLATLNNSQYLPENKNAAERFHFPYPSNSFDFIILTSVFTHVNADVVRNYLDEINRVLVPNGRMLATFFLYSHNKVDTQERLDGGVSFPHTVGAHSRVMIKKNPAAATAYDMMWLAAQIERRGLEIVWPVSWGFQDIVVAEKRRRLPLKTIWRRFRERNNLWLPNKKKK